MIMKKLTSLLLAAAVTITGLWIPSMPAEAARSGTSTGSYGFFQSRGSTEAMKVLDWGVKEEGSTALGVSYDATDLTLMLKSLEYIEECNSLRAQHGLPALLVTDYMMAVAQVQLNWSDTNTAHSQFYQVGENLSWNYRDPFDGWYTEEKKLFELGVTDFSTIGHYLNIVNSDYQVTGFAVSRDNRGRWDVSYGQTFSYRKNGGSGKDHVAETAAQYRLELQTYINNGGVDPASLVDRIASDAPLDATPVVMYRLYNPNSGEHFYTSNETEKTGLVKAGWRDEHQAWVAPAASNTPVYRMYNENAGDHHYTFNYNEVISLLNSGWSYEGIGWYSNPEQAVPLYRLYNPNARAGSHHYTTNAAERDQLVRAGWKDESVGWYGL